MLVLAAMIVLSIAAMVPGIRSVMAPAVVMAAMGTLVRTGAAAVGPLPISSLVLAPGM